MPLRNPYASLGVDDPAEPIRVSQLPAYVVWAVWGFVHCWWETRRLSTLFQGLPAILLAVVLGMLLISRNQSVSLETIDGYLARAEAARALENYDEAEFYFRKLEQIAPDDRNAIEQHAYLHADQGNYGEAFRMMEALVRDEDQSNDVEIHLWLAKTALTKDVGIESRFEYAKSHLVAVLEDDPTNRYAQYFFARVYLRQGDVASAIEHLQHVASYSSELQLLLASLYVQLDPPDVKRSQAQASSAVSTLEATIRETQTADVNTYHQLAAGYVLLGKFEDSVRTLRQALTKFNIESTQRRLSKTFVAWSDDIAKKRPEAVGERMKFLEKALELAPNEPLALNRMLEIASAEGPGAEEAEQKLRQALVDGIAPAIVHFSLGSLAAKRGDSEAAMRHFKQSAQLNPRTAVTLNNMAYIMAHTEDADLIQALELVNQALSMAPTAHPFRETRGQILLRLNRWSEAITDLEYANSGTDDLPTRIEIHRGLAVAYEKINDPDMSAVYRTKLEELVAEAQSERPGTDETVPDIDFDKAPDDATDTVNDES